MRIAERRLRFMVGTAAIALLVLGQAAARPVELNPEVASFHIENLEFRTALQLLSRQVGATFEIRPGLQGKVTFSAKRVLLSTIVRHLAIQVDGGYEVRDGKYVVFAKETNPSGVTIPYLEIDKRLAMDALREVFRHHPKAKWEVEGTFRDGVNLKIEEEVPFEFALRRVLPHAQGDYQVSKGVYYVQVGEVVKVR
ncbi:MAG TPA: hypothetical protein PLX06_02720 [Fimbriimonadaceae bacterium]|nr:hypothetical protein [Fimbriimonadaceae bacterium]